MDSSLFVEKDKDPAGRKRPTRCRISKDHVNIRNMSTINSFKKQAILSVNLLIFILTLFLSSPHKLLTSVTLAQQQNFLVPGHNLENIRISETQPVDTIVHTLKAVDRFNEARRFSYHMTGDTFSVNEETGEIKLVKPLDRERQSQVVVVVSVFDSNDAKGDLPVESKRRTIIIEDVDDSKPQFGFHKSASPPLSLGQQAAAGHTVYQVEVSELAPLGSIVLGEIQVTDADEGINAEIFFECRPKHSTNNACEVFSIESRRLRTGSYSVTIRTKAQLDFERVQFYRLSLNARGKRPSPLKGVPLESEAIVNINISNVQDEGPVFLNAPYSLSMEEGLKSGTRLLNLYVQDGDAAPQRELSMIVVSGPFSEYFQVSKDPDQSKLWYLETNAVLDRENPLINDIGNMFTISLLAAELDDSGQIVANTAELNNSLFEPSYAKGTLRKETVTVLVLDLPDTRPMFIQASTGRLVKENAVVVNISEAIVSGSPIPNLDLAVLDIDQGINSRFNLSLMDIDSLEPETTPAASSAFALETQVVYGKAEVVLNVINSSLIDYEVPALRSYRFNLVASKNNDPPLIQILEVQLNIQDTNDNWPEFDRDQFVVEVPEGASPGTVVATIKARDKDSGLFGRLEYSLRGFGASKFKLAASEGRIVVADCGISQCLDYETQPVFSLTYEAHDGGGKSKNVSLIINVIDINDHRPRFTESVYKRELISDNLSSKQNYISPQLIVRATDDDGPSQGRNNITYKILRTNLTGLDVEPQSGLIYFSELLDLDSVIASKQQNSQLNRDTRPAIDQKLVFEAEVLAQDNGNPVAQNATARILLTVKGNREGAPQFKQDFYQAFVRENHPINKPFYQVQAIDPDDKDSQLRYSLGFDLNDLVSINPITGELAFKTKVDYDDFRGQAYNITVHATDNGRPYPLRASAALGIIIQDVNDKPPKFLESEYKTTLMQARSKPGDIVLEVQAQDPDKNALLNYSLILDQLIVNDRNGQQFSLTDLVDSTRGYLSYMTRQDRLQLANNLKRLFTINKKSGQIELKHEPDYSFVSSLIVQVKVQDLNQEVFGQPNEPAVQTDFATCTFYFQTFVDRSPVFAPPWTLERREYNVSMLEEQPIGTTIFSLLAKEPVTNSRVEMFEKLHESDPRDLFQVSRSGLITLNKRIDYEELPVANKKLSLAVKALTNDGYFSTANLNIQVVDLNDNAPQFSANQNYSIVISEALVYPQEILTVHADDRDSNQFGQVFYSLAAGYSSDYFTVDPKKGTISVKKGAKLDRDTEAQHSIQVVASDCNETISSQTSNQTASCKRSSVLVQVQLLDENDNDPVFLNVNKLGEFEAITSETVSVGAVIAQAQAVDVDEGANGQINYEIVKNSMNSLENEEVSKLFKINKDGLISVAESLAGMGRSQAYKLTIRAFDQGKSISRQSFAYLLLTISDVVSNDGIPRFIRPRPDELIQLSENTGPNTFVYQVQALDPDEGSNGKLMFKFMTHSDVFDIDPFDGTIKTQNRLNFHLDRELVANYTLIVVAQDLGSPPKQAQLILSIKITDVNDNDPYFERNIDDPPVMLFVEEEIAARDTLVGTIRAVDKDIGVNALIGYEILEGNTNNMFKLSFEPELSDQPEGNNPCRIISTGRLDRETRESYTLTIRATSMSKIRNPFIHQIKEPLGGRGSFNGAQYNASDLTKIRVTIKLIDVNDNRPTFIQQNAKSIVDSSAEVCSQLMVFKAIDADSSNPEIQYSILEVLYYSDSKYKLLDETYNGLSYQYHAASLSTGNQPVSMRHAFDIDPRTGILRNTVSLRAYIDGYFEIYVKADNGYNQLSSLMSDRKQLISEENELLSYTTDNSAKNNLASSNSASTSCDEKSINSSTIGHPYAELENCFVAVTKAVVFVTHQRETFRFVFNKTKLNDRLDEFKSKIQLALEEIMFEPSQQLQAQAVIEQNGLSRQQLVPRAEKVFLNTFNTQYYERDDGRPDFSTLTSCSQLVKFDDRQGEESRIGSANQVITYDEVLNLLKNLNASQTRAASASGSSGQQKGSLFAQYGLINIERCPPDKTLYRMSLSEKVALYFAAMIALVGSLLALIVSNMRKNYERKLRLLQRSRYQIELMCGSVQNIRPLFF